MCCVWKSRLVELSPFLAAVMGEREDLGWPCINYTFPGHAGTVALPLSGSWDLSISRVHPKPSSSEGPSSQTTAATHTRLKDVAVGRK